MNKKLKNGLAWRGEPLENIRSRNNCPCFEFVIDGAELNPSDVGFDNPKQLHSKATWANIAAEIGVFASASVAKGSGWNLPLEKGFTEAFFSKSDGTPLFVFIIK